MTGRQAGVARARAAAVARRVAETSYRPPPVLPTLGLVAGVTVAAVGLVFLLEGRKDR